jgi:sterol desaturase/sphingolipid hydroxylase (fatty acid hydroxylase superfamily)
VIARRRRRTDARDDEGLQVSVEEQATSLAFAGPDCVKSGPNDHAITRRVLVAFACYFIFAGWIGLSFDWLIPDHVSATFFGHVLSLENIRHHIVAGGTFGLLLVPAAFAAELFFVGWRGSSLRHLLIEPSASGRSDIVFVLLWQSHVMNICKAVLTFGASLLTGTWFHDRLRDLTGVDLGFGGLPAPLSFCIYFLLFTFCDYWAHRLDHTRIFWPTHRSHHSAQDFCIVTSDRGHPANFTVLIVSTIPLGLLGTPPETAFWIYLLVGAEHLLIHSRVDSDFGWIGRYAVQSPNHHRLHHALDTTPPTANFSLIPLWDRMFGTWRDGGSQQTAIGVSEPYRHGLWIVPDLWRDYCEFVAGVFLSLRRLLQSRTGQREVGRGPLSSAAGNAMPDEQR